MTCVVKRLHVVGSDPLRIHGQEEVVNLDSRGHSCPFIPVFAGAAPPAGAAPQGNFTPAGLKCVFVQNNFVLDIVFQADIHRFRISTPWVAWGRAMFISMHAVKRYR